MIDRKFFSIFILSATLLVAGCATTRNYQSDIDALNARINALQSQLASKDEEISKLQSEMGQHQSALADAGNEKKALSDKIDALLAEQAASKKKTAIKVEDSDLK